jgi:hypothetical protein
MHLNSDPAMALFVTDLMERSLSGRSSPNGVDVMA